MAQDSRKSELIAELAHARHRVTEASRGVKREANFSRRLTASIMKKPAYWVGGAGLLGWIFARLPARTKKVVVDPQGKKVKAQKEVVKAGLFVTVLKLVFDLVRPALTKWVTQRATEYAQQYVNQRGGMRG